MTREFTNQDAKQLVAKHQTLLKKLRSVEKAYEEECKVANLLYAKLLREGEIETQASDELANKNYKIREGVRNLIVELFRCKKFYIAQKECKRIQDEYKTEIEHTIAALQPATSSIRWFFASYDTQERAVRAFESLQELLDGAYIKNVTDATDIIDNAGAITPSQDIALEDFTSHLKLYRSLFYTVISSAAYSDQEPIHLLSKTLEKQEHIDSITEELESKIEDKKRLVKAAADRCAAKEALYILEEVPVEEVNHHGSGGIRVKVLHDYGYDTMADIYAASVYQLASIRGISEDSAYEMKRIVESFLQTSQKTARIRINADDKNRESTELVKALCAYRSIKSSIDEVDALNEKYGEKLKRVVSDLKRIGNGTEWLFFSEDNKDNSHIEYKYIQTVHAGKYESALSDALQAISGQIQYTDETAWADFSENSIAYYSILENIIPGILGGGDAAYGLPEDLARAIQDEAYFPDGLLCELRPYQELGVKYILHQEKALLGDEMGLGKTIQAIATMVSLRNTGATHFVVVCPASVLSNWCREIQRHSKLKATKVHGAGRNLAVKSWIKTGGVAVTTYETTAYFKLPENQKYDLLVVDEAHYIKNKKAKRTKNVIKLGEHTDRMLFMTGTALENRVDEMISLIADLQPDIARRLQSMAFMSTAPQFREAAAPVYYRRKRDVVKNELPDLIENEDWCILTSYEEEIYERTVLSKNYAAARRVSWNVDNLRHSSKAKRLLEIIEDAEEDGRKVIVFSFFLDTIRKVGNLLAGKCYGPINGSVPPERRQQILDEFHDAPAGSVLISQIQSGGTGLNIQDASVVVLCEPQLKPSIENQAIARAHRMGQSRNVLVHRLLCEDTIDERITDMLEQKQAIFDAFADKSVAAEESMNIEIDNKTLGTIIQEEIDRINEKNGNAPVIKKAADEYDPDYSESISDQEDVWAETTVMTDQGEEQVMQPADMASTNESEARAAIFRKASTQEAHKNQQYGSGDTGREYDYSREVDRKTRASGGSTDEPLADYLRKRKFNIIDNQNSSGILWVVFNSKEDYVLYKGNIERIFEEYKVSYAYESRGAMATKGKPAYRVMIRKG